VNVTKIAEQLVEEWLNRSGYFRNEGDSRAGY